jgi:hypothetical protein
MAIRTMVPQDFAKFYELSVDTGRGKDCSQMIEKA